MTLPLWSLIRSYLLIHISYLPTVERPEGSLFVTTNLDTGLIGENNEGRHDLHEYGLRNV